MRSSDPGPVRPVLGEEPARRPGWQAAGAAALGLVLLIVVLWLLGRDGAVEETTVPTTLAAPTTTAVTTTTAVPGIVAAPILAEDASLWPDGPLVAVSAGEAWTVMKSTPEGSPDLIGHLEDGAWTFWHTTPSEEEESGRVGPNTMWGLAVAPNGTVWAATDRGVFSFDGVEWTRRLDDPAVAVAVDEGGTVWISEGRTGREALARWDGESWERVQWPLWAAWPVVVGSVAMAVLPGGEVWVTGSYGCDTGRLMHNDGTTLEAVEVTDRPFLLGGSYVSAVEAAPNGDLWVGGFLGRNPGVSGTGVETWTEPPVLARFDGEGWTVYDSPPYDPTWGCYNALLDLAVGPDGVVWWASGSGLVSFDGTEWTTPIDGRYVRSVDVAPDGTVWYADDYGIHTLGLYECTSDEPPAGIRPPAGSGEGSPQIPIAAVTLGGAAFMEREGPVEDGRWGCGFVVEAESLIDWLFFPASQYWDEGAVWWDTSDGQERWIELDLGGTFTIDAAIVQADDNDSYLLSYRDLGTGEWVTMWSIPGPGGGGMQTRPNPADNTARQVIDPPITTDRLRFEADQGDNLYSVSEIQVFGTAEG